MKQLPLIAIILALTVIRIHAQQTEDFESDALNGDRFNNNGQSFTITSLSSPDQFEIDGGNFAGWNGTAKDHRFISNAPADDDYDGASFSISTTDGADILVKSLYFYLSTSISFENPTMSTLTIEGKKDGATAYSISKGSGFSDVENRVTNNGFTLIDFSTEGGADNSNTAVDQLVFTTTGDGDYVMLDAFTWDAAALSTNAIEHKNALQLLPNPSTDFIEISGLSKTNQFKIYNTLGKEVSSGVISANEKIDVGDLTPGLYILKLGSERTFKLVIE